jgi:hypothetical protein
MTVSGFVTNSQSGCEEPIRVEVVRLGDVTLVGVAQGELTAPRRYVRRPGRIVSRAISSSMKARTSARQSMIRKSGHRFSEKIMLKQRDKSLM